VIKGAKLIKSCRACGVFKQISVDDHKLTNFITKNIRPGVIAKDTVENDTTLKVEEGEYIWSVDTSDEAVQQRKIEALNEKNQNKKTEGGGEDDVKKYLMELKEFVSALPKITVFVSKVQRLQRQFGWEDTQVIQNLFMTLFDSNIIYQINPLGDYLEPFVCDERDQRLVLNCLEKLCHIDNAIIENIVHILYGLYDKDVIEEDTFYKWHKAMNKKLNVKISRQVRINAKPFIQWLQEAEVEVEEDLI